MLLVSHVQVTEPDSCSPFSSETADGNFTVRIYTRLKWIISFSSAWICSTFLEDHHLQMIGKKILFYCINGTMYLLLLLQIKRDYIYLPSGQLCVYFLTFISMCSYIIMWLSFIYGSVERGLNCLSFTMFHIVKVLLCFTF